MKDRMGKELAKGDKVLFSTKDAEIDIGFVVKKVDGYAIINNAIKNYARQPQDVYILEKA